MLVLGQFRELEAQTWLKLKLESSCIHCKHLEVKIHFSLGSICGQKYDKVPKSRLVADGPQIIATTYCSTRFFALDWIIRVLDPSMWPQTVATKPP